MMGVNKRPASPDGKLIEPVQAHGVTMMSLGLMLKDDEAVVWRGPMIMGALQQLLGQVLWGELDVLIIDLPPGDCVTSQIDELLARFDAMVAELSGQSKVADEAFARMHDLLETLRKQMAGVVERLDRLGRRQRRFVPEHRHPLAVDDRWP